MKCNKINLFVNMIALSTLCAYAQLSYAGDMEKEKKGDEQQAQQKLNLERIYFVKTVEGEGIKVVDSILLKKNENYYLNNTTGEMHIALTPVTFEGFLWSKFLGEVRDEVIVNSAKVDAIQEYKAHMSVIQKRPGTFATLVGIAGVASTAAMSMLFGNK